MAVKETHNTDNKANGTDPVGSEMDIEQPVAQEGQEKGGKIAGPDETSENPSAAMMAFPDGGARAWSVAAGAAGVFFCTFGYVNNFGFVSFPRHTLPGTK